MAGTDVYSYKSTDYSLDQTYYGNGCGSGEYPEGEDSSKVSCSSRFSDTLDGETQIIGAYYTFNSAASGSGGYSVTTLNSNTPDTFCPLGWQLPYSGTGGDYYDQSKSWQYLFNQYGLIDDVPGRNAAMSYPLSLLRGGLFSWYDGKLYNLDGEGDFQSITTKSETRYYWVLITTTVFHKHTDDGKANGRSIRCNPRVSILILKHN